MKIHDNAVIYANAMHEYDAKVISPLRRHEEMHDIIKEYARVSFLYAP